MNLAPYTVMVGSTPNTDFPAGQQGPRIRCYQVAADSVEHATELCRTFIRENDLGGGNWIGGRIYEASWRGGQLVGRVRYNGTVGHDDRPDHILDRYGAR